MRKRIFGWLARMIVEHPRAILAASVLLFGFCLYWLGTGHLGVHGSRHSVVDADDPEQLRYMGFLNRFGGGYDIVVLLEGDDLTTLQQTATSVAATIEKHELVSGVFHRVDVDALAQNAPYYLPLKELQRFKEVIDLTDSMKATADPSDAAPKPMLGLASLLTSLGEATTTFTEEGELPTGVGKNALDTFDLSAGAAFLADRLGDLEETLARGGRPFAYDGAFSHGDSRVGFNRDGYLALRTRPEGAPAHALLMQVRSNADLIDEKVAIPLTNAVREAVASLPKGVAAAVTGIPVLFADERITLTSDIGLMGVLSTVVTLVVFLVAYRSFWSTITAFVPLFVGTAMALTVASFIYGALGLVSSIIAVILVGLGIDYATHLHTRFDVERSYGGKYNEIATRTIVGVGPALFAGAFTTIASFMAMAMSDFRATRELGVIASVGLTLVLIMSLILLPVLERMRKRNDDVKPEKEHREWVWPKRTNSLIIIVGTLITIGLGVAIRPIEFNFDAKAFLPDGMDSMRSLHRLEAYGLGEMNFAVLRAPTPAASLTQLKQLESLGPAVVSRTESVADILPQDLDAKEPLIAAMRKAAKKLPDASFEAPAAPDPVAFRAALASLVGQFESDLPFTLKQLGQEKLAKELTPVTAALQKLQKAVTGVPDETLGARLQNLDRELQKLFTIVKPFFKAPETKHFHITDLPENLTAPFYQPAKDGQPEVYAVRVYPTGAAEDPVFVEKFTKLLRDIDGEATGAAITYAHFAQLMKHSLVQSGFYALIIVFIVVLIDLRRPRDIALAFVPLVMGSVWMVGAMNVFGVEYTFSNVLAIPLLIGLGIDSGIHVIHRYNECGSVGFAVQTTGRAIIASSLGNIGSFGVLVFTDNKGTAALGATLCIGMTACLLLSVTFLPAILSWLDRRSSGAADESPRVV